MPMFHKENVRDSSVKKAYRTEKQTNYIIGRHVAIMGIREKDQVFIKQLFCGPT